MGIENRDYFREGNSYSGSFLAPGGLVTRRIIIACAIVYVLQILGGGGPTGRSAIADWLILDTEKVVYQFQIWRLVTCAFCHGGIYHILFNMWALHLFGPRLEQTYGPREYFLFYLASAAFSSLAYVAMQLHFGETIPALGASGAVYAVTLLFAIHFPRHVILILGIIPIEARWFVFLTLIFELHPVLLQFGGTPDTSGVAHVAHLGGMLFAFLYWRSSTRLDRYWSSITERFTSQVQRTRARSSGLRIYRPEKSAESSGGGTSLDREVDRILEKISESGQDSLTSSERATLERASERYRRRK